MRALLFVLALLCSCFVSSSAEASVTFKSSSFSFSPVVGQPYSLNLCALLSSTGNGPLKWGTLEPLPAWLTPDFDHCKIVGNPQIPNLGQIKFTLAVSDGENGALAQVTLNVTDAPVWKSADIDLGTQTVGAAWSFDLRTVVTDPLGGAITFSATGLPAWMSLDPSGILSGTPQKANVGDYSGIVFTASARGGSSQASGHGTVVPRGSQLAIVGPATITAHTCRKFTVQTQDGDGNPLPVASNVTVPVLFAGTVADSAFAFTSASCSGAPTSQLTVPAGAAAVDFYVDARTPGDLLIRATAPAFQAAQLPVSVVDGGAPKIVLSAPNTTIAAGGCLPVAITLQDAAGELWIPSVDTVAALAANRPDVTFFSDNSCATSVSQSTVPAGSTGATFYVSGTRAEPKTIVASSPGFSSGSLAITVQPNAATSVVLTTPSPVVMTGSCTPVSLQLQDRFGNPALASMDLPVSLSATGVAASGVQFFGDLQCKRSETSLTVMVNSSGGPFYVLAASPGALTVLAAPPAGIAAGQLPLTVKQPPGLSFSGPTSLDFGNVFVGDSKDLALTVQNTGGDGTLGTVSIVGDRFQLLPGSTCVANGVVPAGGSCSLLVRFSPSAVGAQSGAVAVTWAGGSLTAPLTGQGVRRPSFVFLNGSDLDFGTVYVGATKDLSLTIQNQGGDGALPALQLTGDRFQVLPGSTCGAAQVLASGASCRIDVRFSPTAAGAVTGSIQLGALVSHLKGTGVLPANFILVGGPNVDFGSVLVNSTKQATVTLWNQGGDGTLVNFGVTGGGFSVVGGSCAKNQKLASGATCTLVLQYAPTAVGPSAGTLTLTTDVGNVTSHLSGRGVTPGALAVNPAGGLNFGVQPIGTAHAGCVTVANVGGSDVSLGAIALVAPGPFVLSTGSACGAPCYAGLALGPQASCGIPVQWATTVGGNVTDWIRIDGTTLGQPLSTTYPVSGAGYVPPPAPTATILANGTAGYLASPVDAPVTIAWASTNATSCNVTQSDLAARYAASRVGPVRGGSWVGPTWGGLGHPGVAIAPYSDPAWLDVTYTLTCHGLGGDATASVRVQRYAWAAGGELQAGYLLGSQAEAQACAGYIYAGVKFDRGCRDASWGMVWADGTRNPWFNKPGTGPGQKWCTCYHPETAPPGKAWVAHALIH